MRLADSLVISASLKQMRRGSLSNTKRRNTEFFSAISVTRKAPPDMDWRCTNARLMTMQWWGTVQHSPESQKIAYKQNNCFILDEPARSQRCCPSLVPSFSLCWAFAYRLLHKRLQLSTDAAGPQHPSSSAVGDGMIEYLDDFCCFHSAPDCWVIFEQKEEGVVVTFAVLR